MIDVIMAVALVALGTVAFLALDLVHALMRHR